MSVLFEDSKLSHLSRLHVSDLFNRDELLILNNCTRQVGNGGVILYIGPMYEMCSSGFATHSVGSVNVKLYILVCSLKSNHD